MADGGGDDAATDSGSATGTEAGVDAEPDASTSSDQLHPLSGGPVGDRCRQCGPHRGGLLHRDELHLGVQRHGLGPLLFFARWRRSDQ